MRKVFDMCLFEKGKEKYDDAICSFYVIAETEEEAIAKAESAFEQGCLIDKTYCVKYYPSIFEFKECEVEGVFLREDII